jgi:uncharacterized protein YjbJ (UPF0337 family)
MKGTKMEKVRTKAAAKQVEVSVKKSAPTGDVKLRAKRNAEKALGKGKGALGRKKDKLSNDFST